MKYVRILCAAIAVLAVSCIKNNIPYPVVELNILGIQGQGFTVENIDAVKRIVTLELDPQTDIRAVQIDSVQYTEGAKLSQELTGTFDLTTPLTVTLSLYQDYVWTIRADQAIDRDFQVDGQVGAPAFDIDNFTATARLVKGADVRDVNITALQLGPEGITAYSATPAQLSGDFTNDKTVDVSYNGMTEHWTLHVEATADAVTLTEADAWSQVIWLYGEGISEQSLGFRYRQSGSEEWQEVPDVKVDNGTFTAALSVAPQTSYEVKAYCEDTETPAQTLTTDTAPQLPNAGFETWSQPKSPWLPYAVDADGNPVDQFWDTGNKGSTTLGAKNNVTEPSTDVRPGSSGQYSAQMTSRFVGELKFAAGNMVAGEYVATRGANGIIDFGRPFTQRPTALRFWVKYTCGNITDFNGVPAGTDLAMGDPDIGGVYIAMGTWTKEEYGYGYDGELFGTDDSPIDIDTRMSSTFFDPKSKDVIGYGEYYVRESIPEWTQITIPITYRSTDEAPTHIVIVCASSRYGDWFTGSRNSQMWIDDVELVYDPSVYNAD